MGKQVVKAGLGFCLLALLLVMIRALDLGLSGRSSREQAQDLVLLAEKPEDPQRAIVIVRSSRLEGRTLTVELELRNNSEGVLTGHVWGQAQLSDRELVESDARPAFKARVKTFKTLRFALPEGTGAEPRVEVFVLDDATGVATKYGTPGPTPEA